ncbi:MAG: aminoacyl-tRNA hydrolase, partial [Candidatus Pacearchaeota archaeon]|nr:aminoacyl-tRNA hydrolase [Candidatus Pacearchaeota archaeon]
DKEKDKPRYSPNERDNDEDYRESLERRSGKMDQPVQYIIIRKDLCKKNGFPAMMVQASHSSMIPISNQLRDNNYCINDEETKKWISGDFVKIILEVEDKKGLEQLTNKLGDEGIDFFSIYERKFGGELTSIGIKPYSKEKMKKIVGYLKPLKDLETTRVYANNVEVNSPKISYSQREVEEDSGYGVSTILEVNMDSFLNGITTKYNKFLDFLKRNGKGTGDDYVDTFGEPKLEYLKKNDFKFNQYFLETHYDTFLDFFSKDTKNGNNKIKVVSLENIFYIPNKIFILGKSIEG